MSARHELDAANPQRRMLLMSLSKSMNGMAEVMQSLYGRGWIPEPAGSCQSPEVKGGNIKRCEQRSLPFQILQHAAWIEDVWPTSVCQRSWQ